MQFAKHNTSLDIRSIIEQLYNSTEFQYKLEQKLDNFIKKISKQQHIAISSNSQSEKLIEEISKVIDNLIKVNLQSALENEFKGFKEQIAKLREEFKNQIAHIDTTRRKIEKQPLSFGQTQNQGDDVLRNRFQIVRKPANLVVTGGGGITTYTTTSPTYQAPSHKEQAKQDIPKLRQELDLLKKQIIHQPPTLQLELKQISNKLQKNNERIKVQLDSIVKNSDTRFQHTQQSIKKHMERSLQSLWKMITSIKLQLQDINSELHLNQSGILQ